jgi:hypothetical protein
MRTENKKGEKTMEKEKVTQVTSRTKAGAWAAVGGVLVAATIMTAAPPVTRSADAADKPNIVFIMGDDIGMWNIGAYH